MRFFVIPVIILALCFTEARSQDQASVPQTLPPAPPRVIHADLSAESKVVEPEPQAAVEARYKTQL